MENIQGQQTFNQTGSFHIRFRKKTTGKVQQNRQGTSFRNIETWSHAIN